MRTLIKFAVAIVAIGFLASAAVEWAAQLSETTQETVSRHRAMLEDAR